MEAPFTIASTATATASWAAASIAPTADEKVQACYLEHAAGLERYARSLVRDADEAADICQEVFLRLLLVGRAGRMPDAPAAWMHRVAHNLVVSGARRRQTAVRVIDRLAEAAPSPSTEDTIIRRERDATIVQALGDIASDGRTAMLLAAQGYRAAEIGRQLGRTELATRVLLCRSRGRLRARLVEAQV